MTLLHPEGGQTIRNPDRLMAPVSKPAFAHLIPVRTATVEQLADDALLQLSRLRDRLVHESANIPACRVDEAIEITLAAARAAMGMEANR